MQSFARCSFEILMGSFQHIFQIEIMSLHPKVSKEMAREMVNTLVNIFQHCEGSGIVSVIRRQLQSTAFFFKRRKKEIMELLDCWLNISHQENAGICKHLKMIEIDL